MQALEEPVTTSFTSSGCQVRAASSPRHSSALAMNALAAPPSSPGQPYSTTVPGCPVRSSQAFTPRAAAKAPAPSRLCPQPCPQPPGTSSARSRLPARWERPDSASYSASRPITGLPAP